jgi:cell division protein FtsW (lipid II flippase)
MPLIARSSPARTKRRRTELGLLLVAVLITVSAYILASLGQNASIPGDVVGFLLVMLGMMLAAHVANRLAAPDANAVMLPIVALLNGLGYVMIARIDYHLASLQLVWTALGVAGYVVTLFVVRRSRDLERYRYLVALVGLGLLLLPLVPHLGEQINGARLWVRLGPVTFQPVELGKLALIVFFASYFVEKREILITPTARLGNHLVPDPRPFGPVVLAWAFSMMVMTAEHDIGFALLLFVIFVSLLWMATGRFVYLVFGVLLFALGAVAAAHFFGQVHVRVQIWVDPWKYANGIGYQAVQAQYAMGTGGLVGTGLGLGHPYLVPVAASDFIFAAFGEEMGLLGTSALVIAYVLFVGAGLRTALTARTDLAKLTAAGFTVLLGFQAFFIMAGVVRLLPLTGITLPFVAYGGSSLVANYVLVALLMRISDETERRVPSAPDPRAGALASA